MEKYWKEQKTVTLNNNTIKWEDPVYIGSLDLPRIKYDVYLGLYSDTRHTRKECLLIKHGNQDPQYEWEFIDSVKNEHSGCSSSCPWGKAYGFYQEYKAKFCKKCGTEIKQREMFFSTFFGCAKC